MKDTWKDAINRQRTALESELHTPLQRLAEQCAAAWGKRDELDIVLTDGFNSVPYSMFMYALDTSGIQVSDNISAGGLLPEHYGRDRSQRPYMREAVPSRGFLLSDAYLSLRASRPSMTALQVVRDNGNTLGYLGVDFDLRDLPVTAEHYEESDAWRQIKGDPAIRGTVFQQFRVDSLMDINMDPAMAILEELLTERGMFQGVIHFSSSRATVWFMSDPFRYRILDHEALSDPDICMLYPRSSYPEYLQRHDQPDLLLRWFALHVVARVPRQGHEFLGRLRGVNRHSSIMLDRATAWRQNRQTCNILQYKPEQRRQLCQIRPN
jgi:hypothetical protein